MNLKLLISFVAGVALLAAGLYLLNRSGSGPTDSDSTLQVLFEQATARDLARLDIKPENEPVIILELDDSGIWRMPELNGLPVDFEKLSRLIDSLVDAEVSRLVTRNPERLDRLGLDQIRLSLSGADGETILDVKLGDTSSSAGRYFQIHGDDAAYVLTQSLFIDEQADGWYEKNPLSFTAEEIQTLEIRWGEETLKVTRPDSETDFALSDQMGDAGSLNTPEIASFIDNLGRIRISNTHDRAGDIAMEATEYITEVTLTPFEGGPIQLAYGRRPEKILPAEGAETEEEPETEPAGPALVFLNHDEASQSPWAEASQSLAYEISSFTYERFALEPEAFYLDEKEETEPVLDPAN